MAYQITPSEFARSNEQDLSMSGDEGSQISPVPEVSVVPSSDLGTHVQCAQVLNEVGPEHHVNHSQFMSISFCEEFS